MPSLSLSQQVHAFPHCVTCDYSEDTRPTASRLRYAVSLKSWDRLPPDFVVEIVRVQLINTANHGVLCKIDAAARGYGLLQLNEAHSFCQQHPEVVDGAVTHFAGISPLHSVHKKHCPQCNVSVRAFCG